jgi:hypothetical protein
MEKSTHYKNFKNLYRFRLLPRILSHYPAAQIVFFINTNFLLIGIFVFLTFCIVSLEILGFHWTVPPFVILL